MKPYVFSIVLLGSICFLGDSKFKFHEGVICGRCSGSTYCGVCRSCNYCAHCNSGGSCGVCNPSSSSKNTIFLPTRPERTRNLNANNWHSKSSAAPKYQPRTPSNYFRYEAIVGNEYLNVREGPGTNYKAFFKLFNGETVTVLNMNNDPWIFIETVVERTETAYEVKGYVHKKYLIF
ncbi:MAG: SH3 domain-containing protein [Bacteroidetes bacterium]|nr:SH3 domain-containing protein [Bacteroidota bacterium]